MDTGSKYLTMCYKAKDILKPYEESTRHASVGNLYVIGNETNGVEVWIPRVDQLKRICDEDITYILASTKNRPLKDVICSLYVHYYRGIETLEQLLLSYFMFWKHSYEWDKNKQEWVSFKK